MKFIPRHRRRSRSAASPDGSDRKLSECFDDKLGVAVDDFSTETAKGLGFGSAQGVLLTDVDPQGHAGKQGVGAGMAILQINGQAMQSANQYLELIRESDVSKGVLLLVSAQPRKHFVLCQE